MKVVKASRESGFAALELVLGVGLLVLPVGALVLTLPRWAERQTTARFIAREVGRAATLDLRCAPDDAQELGRTIARNLGLSPPDIAVSLECAAGSDLPRGGSLEVVVTVRMPAIAIPGIGTIGEWQWSARHRAPVDEYASLP